MKKVAVILVNWNSASITSDCILSLRKAQTHLFDIIVVDNGSSDDSVAQLKNTFGDTIILLYSPVNSGFTGGNNMGMQYAIEKGYTYQMLLNNDTFVEPDFLEPLITYMDQHPEAGIIQSRIFFNHDRSLIWNGGSYFNSFWGYAYTKGYNKPNSTITGTLKKVDWITGCAFFTRTSILKQVGLLAEPFFIYYEDTDLSFRIKNAGYELMYHPDSIVYHIAGMAYRQKKKGKEGIVSPFVHYLNTRNRIWFLKKYTKAQFVPSTVVYNIAYTFALLAYLVIRNRPQKIKAVLKGLRDGLSGRISS